MPWAQQSVCDTLDVSECRGHSNLCVTLDVSECRGQSVCDTLGAMGPGSLCVVM